MELSSEASAKSWKHWAVILVVIAGLGAYCNSFSGPFVYDDVSTIAQGARVATLRPIFQADLDHTTLTGRPVSAYSFAIEYAIAGLDLGVCHGINLAIHLCCALLLFGIVRRTVGRFEIFRGSEEWIAGAAAALWVAHPLTTAAVTYMVQRVESLAAMFYLGVIYCLIRYVDEKRVRWAALAVAACALGMGSKETVVTAPVMALLFDRTFLAGSFAGALKARWKLYAGLAATWVILGVLVYVNRRTAALTFGEGVSSLEYARTQLGVIARYLRLAIWPVGLEFDAHDWPIARSWGDVPVGGWAVLGLMVVTAVAVWAKPWVGFLGCWVFVILSPSSSVVPSATEVMAEQRMYLPLMAVVMLAVVVGWKIVVGLRMKPVGAVIAAAGAGVLMWGTLERNRVYGSEERLWMDTVTKRPGNALAHYAVGMQLGRKGDLEAAREHFETALRIDPGYHLAAHSLGQVLLSEGKTEEAEAFCNEKINSNSPIAPDAHFLRGSIRVSRQDWAGAKEDFAAVAAVLPNVVEAHYQLAVALENLQEWKGAADEFRLTLRLAPNYKDASERLFRLMMSPDEQH